MKSSLVKLNRRFSLERLGVWESGSSENGAVMLIGKLFLVIKYTKNGTLYLKDNPNLLLQLSKVME